MLEVVWRFEPITFYIGSLRVQLILAPHGHCDESKDNSNMGLLKELGNELNPRFRCHEELDGTLKSRGGRETDRLCTSHLMSQMTPTGSRCATRFVPLRETKWLRATTEDFFTGGNTTRVS